MSNRYQAAIITASYNGLLVPNAPTIGTATAGAGSASVAFTAPANVGGGPITSYTVISSPGGITGTGATSPVTVSGLTNGTAYTFTVVATNAYGPSASSAASNSVTPTVNYIEEVFQTWLYTGNDSTQTITNGIDLSGKGGMVWLKSRNQTYDNALFDTNRGATKWIQSNGTDAETTTSNSLTSFNSNGFTLGDHFRFNAGFNYASWTFREQPKFFDVVTWTGDGSTSFRYINHSLGTTPKCIIIKRTDTTSNWVVTHNDGSTDRFMFLNTTAASDVANTTNGYAFASAGLNGANQFILDTTGGSVTASNASGGTYVAYLFAHNAGGFGLTGTDNVISCGSYTGNGSTTGPVIDLGYEPQWLLIKRSNTGGNDWWLLDNMRGLTMGIDADLRANLSQAEENAVNYIDPLATGFQPRTTNAALNASGSTYIYIAIRRGPMRVPTTGTSVYTASTQGNAGDSKTPAYRTTFPVDFAMRKSKTSTSESWQQGARLTGTDELKSNSTAAIVTNSQFTWDYNNGWYDSTATSTEYQGWMFRRAPGFMDVCCYTGTGSARTVAHNLTVVPELMIVKRRNTSASWWVYAAPLGATKQLVLNTDAPENVDSTVWNDTAPTASVFTLGTLTQVNGSGSTFVNYLFASAPGVSKVGSFTGTGATQVINCGFTAGARFVLIKATSASGDWYVWDSARGIVSGNDPYLLLNSTAAEVTNTDWVDTAASGFELSNAGGNLANSNGVSYIFLAIA